MALALLLAACLAAGASEALLRGGPRAFGAAAAAGAVALAAAAARSAPQEERGAPAPPAPARPVALRAALALALVAMALLVGLELADRAYLLQLALLAVAAAAWCAAWMQRPLRLALPPAEALLVAALLALAVAVRTIGLGRAPAGLYGDEAEFALRAQAILLGRLPAPFSNLFDFHPAVYHYLQAAGMAIAGWDLPGLRLASALAGAFTVLPVYALLRRDLGRAGAAGGALLLLGAPLATHIARVGSNNAWVMLLQASAMAATYAALRGARPGAASWAGVSLGLAFYFGNKAIGAPSALALGVLALAAAGVPVARHWRLGALALAAALFVFLPELVHYAQTGWFKPLLEHPVRHVMTLDARAPGGQLLAQLERGVGGLVYGQDRSPLLAHPGSSILAVGEAAAFLVGLGVALGRPRRPLSAFLLAWLVVALVILVLDERTPQSHHLTSVAALPALFAALGLSALGTAFARALALPALAAPAAAAGAALLALQGGQTYFFAGKPWAFAETTEVGRLMRQYATAYHLVLATPPMSWNLNSTLKYMAPAVRVTDTMVQADHRVRWLDPPDRDVVFIVDGRTPALLTAIRQRYPGGVATERLAPDGTLRAAVVVVRRDAVARVEGGFSAPAARPGSR